MRKSFLIYWIGIFIISFTSRACAQGDSALLTLHFVAPSYGYSFTTRVANRWGDSLPGTYHSGTVAIDIDTSIIIPMKDTIIAIFGNYSTSFIIDSSAGVIRNLAVMAFSDEANSDMYGPGALTLWYNDTIDSIVFARVGSAIIIPFGVDEAKYFWDATYGGDYIVSYDEYGDEIESGTQIDTLSLELAPVASSVSSDETIAPQSLSVVIDNDGFYSATFIPELLVRQLDVMDVLGRKIISLPIYSEISSTRITPSTFSPGLYFARLGNEFAKFVVTK